eukprot:UN03600
MPFDQIIGSVGMRLYCKLGDVDAVLQLRSFFDELGVEPNLLYYNSLIEASLIKDDYKTALEYKDSMIKKQISPDPYTYYLLMKSLKPTEWKAGLKFLDEMETQSLEPNQETIVILIDMLTLNGETNMCDNIFSSQRRTGP